MRVGILGHHSGLALRLAQAGLEPVACAEVDEVPPGAVSVDRLEGYFDALEHPRRFLLDLPAGAEVDRMIDRCYVVMEPGDVVLDPTSSYWGDTLRRFRRMRHRSLYYVDCALIEKPLTALVAGDARGVELARAVLDLLVPPGRVVRAGEAGAAHFALMVRAGVATAVTHALSEARQMLEAYPNEAEPEALMAYLWPAMEPDTSSAAWLLDDAVRLHAVIPLLAQGVMLELGAALDDHRVVEVPPRVGGFVHPDEIL
jgi:6-phosphogluconate dehydrogenase